MSIGMDPACDAEPLLSGAEANASGNQRTIGSDGNKQKTTKQAVCEENSGIIRFIPPSSHKLRHPFLEKAKKKLNSKYYLTNVALCNLAHHSNKFLKDNSHRLVRKGFRGSSVEVLDALKHYMDRKTFKIGCNFNGVWKDLHAKNILKYINNSRALQGYDPMSYRAFWRHLNFIEKCTYLNITERKEYKDGVVRSKDALLTINPQLFYDLGITEEDFAKSDKKEESEFARQIREQKRVNFIKNERFQKKEQKKHMRDIRNILNDVKKGKIVSYTDRNYLEEEYPGLNRNKQKEQKNYMDYTNISGYLSQIPLIKPPPS